MTLTVIVPTIGRPSLERTLDSIREQAHPGDRVLTVEDTVRTTPETMRIAIERKGTKATSVSYAYTAAAMGAFGHHARNLALDKHVRTTHWCTIDDDDVYLPGALDAIHEACEAVPKRWHIFGMKFGPNHFAEGVTLPRGRGLTHGEIGTPMIVAPVCKARFAPVYDGDFYMAVRLRRELGEPIWHDRVIAEIRP